MTGSSASSCSFVTWYSLPAIFTKSGAPCGVGKSTQTVLGVNWYLNKNVKFALDYANTDFKGGAAKGDRRTEKIVLSRVQLAF